MLSRLAGSFRIVLLLSVLLAGGSCIRPTTPEDPNLAAPGAPIRKDQVLKMNYSAEIEGDLTVSFSGKIDVRILTLTSSHPDFTGLTLLSVGPSGPVAHREERWFRVAFDLVRYQGDGDYQIRAGSPQDVLEEVEPVLESPGPPEAPDLSNVLIQYWVVRPAVGVQPDTFNSATQPCPVDVSNNGLKGTLTCPSVKDDSGRLISVRMSWG